MALSVECHSGYDRHVYLLIVREAMSHRFHDVICPRLQVVQPCVTTQFHVRIADHAGQQNGLALAEQFIQQWLGLHLVRQRTI